MNRKTLSPAKKLGIALSGLSFLLAGIFFALSYHRLPRQLYVAGDGESVVLFQGNPEQNRWPYPFELGRWDLLAGGGGSDHTSADLTTGVVLVGEESPPAEVQLPLFDPAALSEDDAADLLQAVLQFDHIHNSVASSKSLALYGLVSGLVDEIPVFKGELLRWIARRDSWHEEAYQAYPDNRYLIESYIRRLIALSRFDAAVGLVDQKGLDGPVRATAYAGLAAQIVTNLRRTRTQDAHLLARAEELYTAIDNAAGLRDVAVVRGGWMITNGDYRGAEQYIRQEGLQAELAQPLYDTWGTEHLLKTDGPNEYSNAELAQAETIFQRGGSPLLLARCKELRGDYAFFQRRFTTARNSYREAARLAGYSEEAFDQAVDESTAQIRSNRSLKVFDNSGTDFDIDIVAHKMAWAKAAPQLHSFTIDVQTNPRAEKTASVINAGKAMSYVGLPEVGDPFNLEFVSERRDNVDYYRYSWLAAMPAADRFSYRLDHPTLGRFTPARNDRFVSFTISGSRIKLVYQFARISVVLPRTGGHSMSYRPTSTPWPLGNYRFVLTLDGEPIADQRIELLWD